MKLSYFFQGWNPWRNITLILLDFWTLPSGIFWDKEWHKSFSGVIPQTLSSASCPTKNPSSFCVCVGGGWGVGYCADRSEGQTLKGAAPGCSSKHFGVLGI